MCEEVIYFYRVTEFMTTFNPGQHYSHSQDFKDKNLLKCKEDAYMYYQERLKGFEDGNVKFFLPFESQKLFKFGQNSAYSIYLFFVEYDIESGETELFIEGGGEIDNEDGRDTERMVLASMGFLT